MIAFLTLIPNLLKDFMRRSYQKVAVWHPKELVKILLGAFMCTVGIQTLKGARFLAGNFPAHLTLTTETIIHRNQIRPFDIFERGLPEGADMIRPWEVIVLLWRLSYFGPR